MKKIEINVKSELKLKNIKGYLERIVNKFGTGAKVDCPKEFLGRKVILVILNK